MSCFKDPNHVVIMNKIMYCLFKDQTVITSEADFFQACSFRKILIIHKNFRFTLIPDETNGVIFLKVQSCKLCNNKYMITSTQITNTGIFAFVALLVFKLSSRKVLFINRKDNRNC